MHHQLFLNTDILNSFLVVTYMHPEQKLSEHRRSKQTSLPMAASSWKISGQYVTAYAVSFSFIE